LEVKTNGMPINLYNKSVKAFVTTTAAKGDALSVKRGTEDFRNALINSINAASLTLVDAGAAKFNVTPGQVESGAVVIEGAVDSGKVVPSAPLAVESDFPPDDFGNVGQYALTATGRLWKKVTRPEVYNLNITAATPEQDLFNALFGAWTAHDTPLEEDFPDVLWPIYFDAEAPYYTADFLDGLALARSVDGDWKFISTVDGLAVAEFTLPAGGPCAWSLETDAALPTDVTTWIHGDNGQATQITFETGDALPDQDLWKDMTRPDEFAPRFALGVPLEIAPGIYFHTAFDYQNEWWYSGLTADPDRAIQVKSCLNYAGTSNADMLQTQIFSNGNVTLCKYTGGGNVYMDGTVSLANVASGKSMGVFHLTATSPDGAVLESRRLA
jgi:hypothetical protein